MHPQNVPQNFPKFIKLGTFRLDFVDFGTVTPRNCCNDFCVSGSYGSYRELRGSYQTLLSLSKPGRVTESYLNLGWA